MLIQQLLYIVNKFPRLLLVFAYCMDLTAPNQPAIASILSDIISSKFKLKFLQALRPLI
jgi:hypothetical protein